jgi:hypothetical protein
MGDDQDLIREPVEQHKEPLERKPASEDDDRDSLPSSESSKKVFLDPSKRLTIDFEKEEERFIIRMFLELNCQTDIYTVSDSVV